MKEWYPKETVAQMLNALSRVECGLPTAGIGQVKREEERVLHHLLYCPRKCSEQNGINNSH